jgi:hypothetical protein
LTVLLLVLLLLVVVLLLLRVKRKVLPAGHRSPCTSTTTSSAGTL